MQWSAALPDSIADTALRRLSNAADHSVLWLGIAGILVARPGSLRRAGLRGVAAIAVASAVTNVSTKWAFRRRRPASTLVPAHRRVSRRPHSPSFPSGHAASAAAFTTAVAMEHSAAGAVCAPIAAGVTYSRVHTGVHWPSDVAAGVGLGVGIGIATKRWWPIRPTVPARTRHSASVAALNEGNGLVMIVNPSSGNSDHDPTTEITATWPAARLVYPTPGMDLSEQVLDALREEFPKVKAVGVAGGDGTVAAAAAAAATFKLPLAVVPSGTLNHFGRDVGIVTTDEVSRAVAEGSAVHVGLGTVIVDGNHSASFVNTASLGGYPEMVRLREQWEQRWGKWLATTAALVQVLAQAHPLRIRLNGNLQSVWMLFVGNSGYHPKGFAPAWRPHLDDGVLDVRYLRADVPLSRTRFITSALLGALLTSRTYVQREYDHIDVDILGTPVPFACDGEVRANGNRFSFSVQDGALTVYRPEQIN
jgi:undecaprenyl-diphosphatase